MTRKYPVNKIILPNLQLLEGRSNGSKSNMRLIDYCNDMNTGGTDWKIIGLRDRSF